MAAKTRKSIFITGAASGMGRETALLFAEKDWFVGGYDVVLAAFAEQTDGKLDLLYNNAGIGHAGWFEDVPYEDSMRLIQVNLVGVVNGIYAALPLLRATPGSLCFTTSSSAATYGAPRLAIYAATKHAVKGLTEALAVEFDRLGVRVADVLPGLIDTPILDNSPNHSGGAAGGPAARENAPAKGPFRLMPARAVAECVWEAYHSDRLHWYVPEEIGDLDRAKAAGPEQVRDRMKQMLFARPGPS